MKEAEGTETEVIAFLAFSLGVSFYLAFNIGANDLANAMGTSVGSRALTVKQAVIWAAVLNFCGAVLVAWDVNRYLKARTWKEIAGDFIRPEKRGHYRMRWEVLPPSETLGLGRSDGKSLCNDGKKRAAFRASGEECSSCAKIE